jgi:hypothetical protein
LQLNRWNTEGHKNRDISRVRVATGTGGREGDKKKRYQWTCGFRWNTDRYEEWKRHRVAAGTV